MANSFNDHFWNTAQKLMGANQIDKMNQLKNGVPLNNILQVVGSTILVLNLDTHQLRRLKGL
jgi:hypothetical protein